MGETKPMEWGGFILFFLIFALVFGGGGLFNFGNRNYGDCGCNRVSNCEVEKSALINSARTNYLIERAGQDNVLATMTDGDKTRAKIDFYHYENLKDKLTEKDAIIAQLRSEAFATAKFNALDNKIETVLCQMPRLAPLYAQGVSGCGYPYPGSKCGGLV